MPTITIGELRRLIEANTYDKYAREGSRAPVRGRPQSAKRERSRSRSRTRQHVRPQSADKRSGPARPQSATVVLHYRPQKSPQSTPRRRPDSAKSVTCVPSHDTKKVDYSGLNNMMKSLSFSQPQRRGWKSKSVDFSEANKLSASKDSIEKKEEDKPKQVDVSSLRKNRISSYSKFTYPLANKNLQKHRTRMYMEENIPASLRRLPKYCNQPRRANCSYTPPGVSVTKVKQHSIISKTLPPPPPDVSRKPPLPPSARSRGSFQKEPDNVSEPANEEQNLQRNATYHYVHNGDPEVTIVLPGDDEDDLIHSSREPGSVSPVIVPVQETPRDSNSARPESARVVEKLPGIQEDGHELGTKYGDDSDDSFVVKDEADNLEDDIRDILGDTYDIDKHSYGDLNDLDSVPDELSFEKMPPEKTGFKVQKAQEISDEEIEEDIPEQLDVKTISFGQKKPTRAIHLL